MADSTMTNTAEKLDSLSLELSKKPADEVQQELEGALYSLEEMTLVRRIKRRAKEDDPTDALPRRTGSHKVGSQS